MSDMKIGHATPPYNSNPPPEKKGNAVPMPSVETPTQRKFSAKVVKSAFYSLYKLIFKSEKAPPQFEISSSPLTIKLKNIYFQQIHKLEGQQKEKNELLKIVNHIKEDSGTYNYQVLKKAKELGIKLQDAKAVIGFYEEDGNKMSKIEEIKNDYSKQLSHLEDNKIITPIQAATLRQVLFFTRINNVESSFQFNDIVLNKAKELKIPLEDQYNRPLSKIV